MSLRALWNYVFNRHNNCWITYTPLICLFGKENYSHQQVEMRAHKKQTIRVPSCKYITWPSPVTWIWMVHYDVMVHYKLWRRHNNWLSQPSTSATHQCDLIVVWYCILPYILQGFYFREFRESDAIREFNNMRKYLLLIRPDAWMRLVYAILVVQCTCKVGSLILPSENEWMILISPSIALLFDHKFNHSRKCLDVPIHKKFDLRNIWRICCNYWPRQNWFA